MNRRTVTTTCPYCGVGCGVDVSLSADGRIEKLRGTPDHPANLGKLCSKGSALAETVSTEGRLLHPLVNGRKTSWDEALETVAERFRSIVDEHGPEAVALYVSGQLLTEDYYVANKLMKGFIGSANIDTNSRLCMSSVVAAQKRAFGSDTVPGSYEDLDQADLILLVGSNTAWCHPVLYQRIVRARKAREGSDRPLRVVVIDPRKTASCDIADLHLPLQPGTDAVLFNGLLAWLHGQGHGDALFVQELTDGFEEALRIARWYAPSPTAVAEHCGLPIEQVETLYRWFDRTERTVSLFSQGINQTSSGTDKVNAIINCHLLTGRIGRPGMGPFSLTGQPNAMGGREVGGLSNQLAAHMDFEREEDIERVERFWKASRMARKPGLKAVELFRALEEGRVRALWILGTNPAVSLPDSNRVARALERCDFVVVSDCVETDTTAHADVLLPAATWGEKSGTVTNSERRISRQRAFLEPPGEARPDWWILCALARKMGFEGFDYASEHEIFLEHARLSVFENDGERDFDLSGLADLDREGYDSLEPIQWPVRKPGQGTGRLFGTGAFFTPNRRARFVAVTPRPPAHLTNPDYPLILNTGRVRDQWHTMTRTGRSPRLTGHVSEPFVQIHPRDAARIGLEDGMLAQVASPWGEVILRARVSDEQQKGSLFVPMHWNDRFASAARVNTLVNPALDPVSGQPEFKHTPVRATLYQPAWYGFVLSRREITPYQATYWSRTRHEGLWHYELAGEEAAADWAAFARRCLGEDREGDWAEMYDSTTSFYRAARFDGGRLDACIFIGPDHHLPERDWLARLFLEAQLSPRQRQRVLAGSPGKDQPDAGRIICSCFSVGLNTLKAAIRAGADSPEALGEQLQAGTNCGSCIPELRSLIRETLSE